jgi:RNA polymerase sigma-70 factor (ECF subfamily)
MKLFQGFDGAYVERLRAGDPETEAHFIEYFGELIRIKLRSRLASRATVEDVRQETFLRVFQALRSPNGVRQPERLGAFVNSVCNNVLREQFRSQQRHPPTPGDEAPDVADTIAADAEAQLLGKERTQLVREILDQLPARHSQVLRAVFVEEEEKDDLCASLGLDRNYLRVVLHRARLSFRARLSQYQA